MSISIKADFSTHLACIDCKRCTSCLYEAVTHKNIDGNTREINGDSFKRNVSEKIMEAAQGTEFLTIPDHSHSKGTATGTSRSQHKTPPQAKELYCTHGIQLNQTSECYTCSRAPGHHYRLRMLSARIDQLFENTTYSTAATTPPQYPSTQSPMPPFWDHEYQDSIPMERFLLHRHDDQSSILAFGDTVGTLNLSPQIPTNYRYKG